MNGSVPKWLRITAKASPCEEGLNRRVCGTLEDISERKFIEQNGRDFLSVASHDLRSPLTVIKLYLQMCRQDIQKVNTDVLTNILVKADKQIDRMSKIIQNVWQISTLETGELTLNRERFEMRVLVSEVIEDFHILNPEFFFKIKWRENRMLWADRDKIFQVVENLISNAIKYSPGSNRVVITIGKRGRHLLLAVKDFGIGTNSAEKLNIFHRFYRIHGETNKGIQGYGKGLFISRKIILQHGGEIWLKSRVGKGATFMSHFQPCNPYYLSTSDAAGPRLYIFFFYRSISIGETGKVQQINIFPSAGISSGDSL